MLRIAKKEDGFWLIVETEGKHAMINLGFPEHIVGDVLEEAAQHSVQPTVLESGQIEDHNFVDGVCTFCGKAQPHSG